MPNSSNLLCKDLSLVGSARSLAQGRKARTVAFISRTLQNLGYFFFIAVQPPPPSLHHEYQCPVAGAEPPSQMSAGPTDSPALHELYPDEGARGGRTSSPAMVAWGCWRWACVGPLWQKWDIKALFTHMSVHTLQGRGAAPLPRLRAGDRNESAQPC